MVVRQLFILLMLLIFAPSAFATSKIEASVDRNPVMEGEYFVLTVSADDEVDAGNLDTSLLLKDFIVGRTSVSRSTQIMNFDAKKETRWQVLLAPKRQGKLTIPSFTIDKVSSTPIVLSVVAPGSQTEQAKSLFIETSLANDEAYVGQLILYKVRLFLAVELQRGVLSAPTLTGAQIKQIGEDKDDNQIVDGRRYRVIERTYGIIADTPGELTIDGATFSGDVLIEAPRGGGMFGFNESRPMQAASPTKTLLINPIPASYQGDWLVADLVVLKDNWPEDQTEFAVGNPITRTLTLLASNADDTSLPDIKMPLPETLKNYPEKPQRQTFVRNGQLVSQLSQTQAIVPTQAGTITLPEVTVPWWNPILKKQEFATLPARTIQVTGALEATPNLPVLTPFEANQSSVWPWTTLLFGSLWLITLVLWRRAIKQTPLPTENNVLSESTTNTSSASQLAMVCKTGQSNQILAALQTHLSHQYRKSLTLNDIAQLSPAMAKVIANLQQAAYSKTPAAFEGNSVLDALKTLPNNRKSAHNSALSPLNP